MPTLPQGHVFSSVPRSPEPRTPSALWLLISPVLPLSAPGTPQPHAPSAPQLLLSATDLSPLLGHGLPCPLSPMLLSGPWLLLSPVLPSGTQLLLNHRLSSAPWFLLSPVLPQCHGFSAPHSLGATLLLSPALPSSALGSPHTHSIPSAPCSPSAIFPFLSPMLHPRGVRGTLRCIGTTRYHMRLCTSYGFTIKPEINGLGKRNKSVQEIGPLSLFTIKYRVILQRPCKNCAHLLLAFQTLLSRRPHEHREQALTPAAPAASDGIRSDSKAIWRQRPTQRGSCGTLHSQRPRLVSPITARSRAPQPVREAAPGRPAPVAAAAAAGKRPGAGPSRQAVTRTAPAGRGAGNRHCQGQPWPELRRI